jgi:hypothetical protein
MRLGKKELNVGLTEQQGNMYYLGITYMNVIRGHYLALDLIWFGVYVQLVGNIKPKLTRVES